MKYRITLTLLSGNKLFLNMTSSSWDPKASADQMVYNTVDEVEEKRKSLVNRAQISATHIINGWTCSRLVFSNRKQRSFKLLSDKVLLKKLENK